jgi:RNA polymerase sigma-70 factor (ECF subfamily)
MFRVALRILGDADAAQDVVQDACLKGLRAVTEFNGRASLVTWLHRITVNCARDRLRAERRETRDRVPLDAEIAGALATLETSPPTNAERSELYQIAVTLVEALPEDCRESFILTQMDGYSYDEAAEIEGRPRGTVASRVNRAKRILLEQLGAQIDRTE